MIIKVLLPDGTLDVDRCQVYCDAPGCGTWSIPLLDADDWLFPPWAEMPIYCPACTDEQAYALISSALYCPRCYEAELRFWDTNDHMYDHYGPHYAGCPRCGAALLVTPSRDICGWFMP